MSEFVKWVRGELRERGWSSSELARRSGLSSSAMSVVMTGQQRPGLQFCLGVAQGLDEPPEKLLRLAGFLPIRSARDGRIDEILHCYDRMRPEAQEYFVRIARALAEEQKAVRAAGMGEPEADSGKRSSSR